MESIGAEVGQKMRSAIKAKLLELNCYVDDELPDYIMVMVANKRTKSQMTEDLNLFLSNKTVIFVNWLHIVLKKLKEVTVTNPEVYKNVVKRKASEDSIIKVKEEKKLKKPKLEEDIKTSLTDNLPITASSLSQKKRLNFIADENFDIPLLSEVNSSTMQELQELEKRIRNVKSRLGDMVEDEETSVKYDQESLCCRTVEIQSDSEVSKIVSESQHFEDQQLHESQQSKEHDINNVNNITAEIISPKRKHSPIIFENSGNKKRISALHRLGDKSNSLRDKSKTVLLDHRYTPEEEKISEYGIQIGKFGRHGRSGILNRNKHSADKSEHLNVNKFNENIKVFNKVGVLSKIHVPQKDSEDELHELPKVEVKSVVQVKPRVIPADIPQPSKNLLLKAVAEAQRSIVQASKPKITRLNEAKSDIKSAESESTRRLLRSEKSKLREIILSNISHEKTDTRNIISEENSSKPINADCKGDSKYISSLNSHYPDYQSTCVNEVGEKQFIVTFDMYNKKSETQNLPEEALMLKSPVKLRLQQRKSPIMFDKTTDMVNRVANIPEKIPNLRSPAPIKKKERCKYWPACRLGVMCEFNHPDMDCENFPNCSFGDKCLYLHPTCKFLSSCTKRSCPFSHVTIQKPLELRNLKHSVKKTFSTKLPTCKYFPNCIKSDCLFYHPKSCKFGKYCRNPLECTFSHPGDIVKPSLTWRSN